MVELFIVNVWINQKFQITLVEYMLDVISHHHKNILFLLFAHDPEYHIESFLINSKIPTLAHNR